MNPLNHATLEASKRLVEAGIVMETDMMWIGPPLRRKTYQLTRRDTLLTHQAKLAFPAPSMAEVWRELPEGTLMEKWADRSVVNVGPGSLKVNANPADALIDLLIWVRKEKP